MNRHDMLKRCCGRANPREWMNTPFRHDGITYATDAIILLALPSVEADDIYPQASGPENGEPERKTIIAADLCRAALYREGHGEFDIGAARAITPATCDLCAGSGYLTTRLCAQCNGEGAVRKRRDWITCRECDGEGAVQCPPDHQDARRTACFHCNGHGQERTPFPVGSHSFDLRYLRILLDIAGKTIVHTSTFDNGISGVISLLGVALPDGGLVVIAGLRS